MKTLTRHGMISSITLMMAAMTANTSMAANISITHLQPTNEGEVFPVVQVKNKPVASQKINTFLQLNHLRHLPNKYKKDPFEKVRFNEKRCCGYTTFEGWKKHATPKNIFSMSLYGEAMGAYPEYFESYENFDARTGNQVLLNHLIKPQRQQALSDVLAAEVRQKITQYIQQTLSATAHKKAQSNTDLQQVSEEHRADQRALYKDCLKGLADVNLSWFSFYVKRSSVLFVKGRCSNHAMRALDDLGTFYIEKPISTLQPYLSAYGKNLLSNAPNQVKNHAIAGKLLKGSIGKVPVYFMFSDVLPDGSANVLYWYKKYQTPIELNGTITQNKLTLDESNYDETKRKWLQKARIHGTWQDGKVTGTWQNAKTNQVYQLKLAEF